MLQRKPNTLQICWPEASLLVNYEADTLPLLFSSDEDFIMYFNTMMELHSRKGRLIEQVRKCNTLARQDRDNGDYLSCVQRLAEACDLRCKMFAAGDYQITSAMEHSIWSQIHLGTLLLTQGNSSDAHHLFTAASDRIKSVRPKSSAKTLPLVNGGSVVILPKKTCDRLNLVLHSNWSNYWARRGKWHAALQHASKAQHLWTLVTSGEKVCLSIHKRDADQDDADQKRKIFQDQELCNSYITTFLACRVNAALCGTWEEPNLNLALKNISSKKNFGGEQETAHLFYSASGVPTSKLMTQTTYDRNALTEEDDDDALDDDEEGQVGKHNNNSQQETDEHPSSFSPPPALGPLKTQKEKTSGNTNKSQTDSRVEQKQHIPLDTLAAQVPGVTFRLVTIDLGLEVGAANAPPPFSFTLCLDSATPEFCTTWPAHVTTLFIETYNSAFAALGLRKYGRAENCLEACASIASKCEADCNPIWWKRVQAMYLLLQDAPGGDKASGFRMTRQDMIQKDVISAAKLVRNYVEADRRATTPSLGRVATTKPLAHPDRASTPTVSSSAVSKSGPGDDESDWGQMTLLFKKKVKPADALKHIGDVERDIATPIQLVRRGGPKALPSRNGRLYDHHQQQLFDDQRPATVNGMLGEFSTIQGSDSHHHQKYVLHNNDDDNSSRQRRVGTASEVGTLGPALDEVTPPSSPLVPNHKAAAGSPLLPKSKKRGARQTSSKLEQDAILDDTLEVFRYEESKSVSRVRRQLDAALQEEREREAHLEACYENLKIALSNCRDRQETLEAARERRIELASPVRNLRGNEGNSNTTSTSADNQEEIPEQDVSLVDIIDHERALEAAEQEHQKKILEKRKNARAVYKLNAKKKQAEGRKSVDRKRSVAFGTGLIPDPESSGKVKSRSTSFISGAFDTHSEAGSESSSAIHGSPPSDYRNRSASGVSNNSSSQLRKSFKSGYKLNVEVDTSAEAADANSKFERSYSTKRKKSVMVTDFDTGVVSAKKQFDYVPEVDTITDKQKRLRSLLPAMDHRTETYRMVMKELAENEQILKLRRSEFNRQKLERNAEKVAKKAGMVSVWKKLVEKKAVERRATLFNLKEASTKDKDSLEENYDVWSEEEISAAALLAQLALSPNEPESSTKGSEAKAAPTETL